VLSVESPPLLPAPSPIPFGVPFPPLGLFFRPGSLPFARILVGGSGLCSLLVLSFFFSLLSP